MKKLLSFSAEKDYQEM